MKNVKVNGKITSSLRIRLPILNSLVTFVESFELNGNKQGLFQNNFDGGIMIFGTNNLGTQDKFLHKI